MLDISQIYDKPVDIKTLLIYGTMMTGRLLNTYCTTVVTYVHPMSLWVEKIFSSFQLASRFFRQRILWLRFA